MNASSTRETKYDRSNEMHLELSVVVPSESFATFRFEVCLAVHFSKHLINQMLLASTLRSIF